MASWGATEAKARFSAVLDQAETEGPQLVRRRKREFYVLTREQMESGNCATSTKPVFESGWDALAPSSGELFDVDFPRLGSEARVVEF